MTSSFRRAAELTGSALARGFRERLVEPRALRVASRRGGDGALMARIEPVRTGDAEAGLRLLAGEARFAGASTLVAEFRDVWTATPPSAAWRAEAHRFAWLADLAAIGDDLAQEAAALATAAWLKRHRDGYDPVVWDPEIAAERLINWLSHIELAAPRDAGPGEMGSGDLGLRETAFFAACAQHGEWLAEKIEPTAPGLGRLRVASATLLACLTLDGWSQRRAAAAARFEEAAVSALRADGGVVGRRPDDIHAALTLALTTRSAYEALELSPPPMLDAMVRQLSAALRFFRLGDGGAPLFHGSRAIVDGRIDLALAATPLERAAPRAMTDSGYARMNGGRVAVIMDVGRAPTGAHAETGHASCLAFEMSSGRRRIIVNCGAGEGVDADWPRTRRTSAAHSTLIVDGVSSAQPALSRRWRAFGEDKAIVGPPETHAERKEERNGVWILGAHDAYFDEYGLTATRRMFLSVDGGDFRGEDNLEALEEGARIFERRIGSPRGAGVPYAAIFHLHPDVSAELVADGEAVTLRLPHGEVWVMRQAGGKLTVEPSVYAPEDGAARRTRRIVVSGLATKKSTQLRWAFRRVGEVAQLPLDVDALLAPTELSPLGALDGPEPASSVIDPRRRKRR